MRKQFIWFLRRNYNLVFNKPKCIQIIFDIYKPKLGEYMINIEQVSMQYLGNNWFKVL